MIGAGRHDIPAGEYHSDPCPEPSISRSIIHALVPPGTPLHARHKHPRLGGWRPADAGDRAMQIGSACHAIMFGEAGKIRIIDADNYKTKVARADRDEAAGGNMLPILASDYRQACMIVEEGRRQLSERGVFAFIAGRPEQTLIWQENDVWCRARLDWLPDNPGSPIDDYKTTAGSASEEIWGRAAFAVGDDIQAAFYRRGVRAVFGVEPGPFRFVVQEQNPPFAINVITLTERAVENANRKIDYALRTWRNCLDSGVWPGYTMGYQVDIPAWREFFEDED